MNIVLWIFQILLGLSFVFVGYNHALNAAKMKEMPGMGWINRVPPKLMTFIGICEILGGIGVVLPSLTGIMPWLTPLAAVMLGLVMILAALFHFPAREYRNMVTNVILFALAAFIAYGRFVLVPLM